MKDEGYKSGDIIGKFGIEKIYDKELRGENGGQQVEVDVSGKPVQILGRKEPVPAMTSSSRSTSNCSRRPRRPLTNSSRRSAPMQRPPSS